MQVGAGFQQMRGEAVTEQVGIHTLRNSGTAGGILAGVAWGLGIDGPSTGVPAITGKQPGAGFFSASAASVRGVRRAERD